MADLFKTSNPALNANTFQGPVAEAGQAMTLQGTVNKTGLLLLCVVGTAAWTWGLAHSATPQAVLPWMIGGAIAGLIFALVTVFKKRWSPITAPIYALCEGLLLGGISALLEQQYPGIAIQAMGLTFGVTAVMLVLYTSRVLRATPKFTMGVIAATGGIFLLYMVDIAMGFFGHHIALLNSSGPWGIGLSVVIVIIAALNLILDFGFVETGVQASAPKYMEWYGAFGIMVTLVWMYVEILNLLAQLRNRR
ncbi:MAG: Bax inhibitor-1/YccA family protein [Candidatus Acidiferrales bacterium]